LKQSHSSVLPFIYRDMCQRAHWRLRVNLGVVKLGVILGAELCTRMLAPQSM
jgi:hypothetical protein